MADLASILLGKQQEMVQTDPFYVGGANIMQNSQSIDPYKFDNPWAGVAAQIGTALLGSAGAAYGRQRGEQKYNNYAAPLMAALASSDPYKSVSSLDGDYGDIVSVLAQNKLNSQMAKDQLYQELAGKAIEKYIENPSSRSEGLVKAIAGKAGIDMPGMGGERRNQLTPVADFARPARGLNPQAEAGPESVERMIQRTAQNLIDEGQATPSQAYQTARAVHKAELDAIERAREQAETGRQKAREQELLSNQAHMYMKEAGDTGGWGPIPRSLQNLTAKIFQGPKYDATQSLDSLAAEIVSTARQAGSGQMSDRDVLMYLQSGPTSANEPETNEAIIQKGLNISKLAKDKAAFTDWYIGKFGRATNIEQEWQRYLDEHPPIQVSNEGAKWNESRPPWQSYFDITKWGANPSIVPGGELPQEGDQAAAKRRRLEELRAKKAAASQGVM